MSEIKIKVSMQSSVQNFHFFNTDASFHIEKKIS